MPLHQRLAHGALDLIDRERLGEHVVHQRIQPVRALALIGKAAFCRFNASSATTPSVATVNSWP